MSVLESAKPQTTQRRSKGSTLWMLRLRSRGQVPVSKARAKWRPAVLLSPKIVWHLMHWLLGVSTNARWCKLCFLRICEIRAFLVAKHIPQGPIDTSHRPGTGSCIAPPCPSSFAHSPSSQAPCNAAPLRPSCSSTSTSHLHGRTSSSASSSYVLGSRGACSSEAWGRDHPGTEGLSELLGVQLLERLLEDWVSEIA